MEHDNSPATNGAASPTKPQPWEQNIMAVALMAFLFFRHCYVMALGFGLIGVSIDLAIGFVTKPIVDLWLAMSGLMNPFSVQETYLPTVHGLSNGFWQYPLVVLCGCIAWGLWANRYAIKSHPKEAKKWCVRYVLALVTGIIVSIVAAFLTAPKNTSAAIADATSVGSAILPALAALVVPMAVFGLQCVRWADIGHPDHWNKLGELDDYKKPKEWFWGAHTVPDIVIRYCKWAALGVPVITAILCIAGIRFVGYALPVLALGSTGLTTLCILGVLIVSAVAFKLYRILLGKIDVWEKKRESEVLDGLVPSLKPVAKTTKNGSVSVQTFSAPEAASAR